MRASPTREPETTQRDLLEHWDRQSDGFTARQSGDVSSLQLSASNFRYRLDRWHLNQMTTIDNSFICQDLPRSHRKSGDFPEYFNGGKLAGMGSRFFTAFAAVSLVICMLTTALWVRSYFILDALDWSTLHGRAGFFTTQGCMAYGAVTITPAYHAKVLKGFSYRSTAIGYGFSVNMMRPSWSSWTGFAVTRFRRKPMSAWDIRIPYWLPLLLSAIAPLLWYRRRHRYPPGTCQQCGYDLRASPDRCPECGAIVSQAA